MSKTTGRFIVVCGIDGAGKTTQEDRLVAWLRSCGREVIATKNPSDWYRKNPMVRAFLEAGEQQLSPDTMAMLAATDRMIQLETEIVPALEAGVDVVCNRYVYSTYAYFRARGADMSFVGALNAKARRPEKGILLTLDPAVAIDRIRARDGDRRKFEERDAIYLGRVQDELIALWPDDFLRLDSRGDQEVLFAAIVKYML